MAVVYIGLGSNIGDRKKHLKDALKSLDKIPGMKVTKRSGVYETKPVGGPAQRDYCNCVVEVETEIDPFDLLKRLKEIEKKLGRTKKPRNHPRVIDLDILMYGDDIFQAEDLVIPHLKLHERSFVLRGFCEIASDVTHPKTGKTIKELYKENQLP